MLLRMESSGHEPVWQLSDDTRELGRRQIADVRSILRSARQIVDTSDHLTDEDAPESQAA